MKTFSSSSKSICKHLYRSDIIAHRHITPAFLLLFLFAGIACANDSPRQAGENAPAQVGVGSDAQAPKGMDSLYEVAAGQTVSREFLRALEARQRDLERRERIIGQKESQLLLLRKDIEAKLARLESMRDELVDMTREVDRSRRRDLVRASQMYAAMDPRQAGRVLIQMELESVVAILKEMDVETAGSILEAMADSGTDSEQMEKLRAISESFIGSTQRPGS